MHQNISPILIATPNNGPDLYHFTDGKLSFIGIELFVRGHREGGFEPLICLIPKFISFSCIILEFRILLGRVSYLTMVIST